MEPLDPPSTGLLLCLSVLLFFAILCTSCVLGVLEVWGGFNDHSEQPDSHFIPSSTTGSGGLVYINVYLLLWVQGSQWIGGSSDDLLLP